MEIGILGKSGMGTLGLVNSKVVGGPFGEQYQNSDVI